MDYFYFFNEKAVHFLAIKKLGLGHAKLSGLLLGQFGGISEVKMMECLSLLGLRVQIVITEQSALFAPSTVEMVFCLITRDADFITPF